VSRGSPIPGRGGRGKEEKREGGEVQGGGTWGTFWRYPEVALLFHEGKRQRRGVRVKEPALRRKEEKKRKSEGRERKERKKISLCSLNSGLTPGTDLARDVREKEGSLTSVC